MWENFQVKNTDLEIAVQRQSERGYAIDLALDIQVGS